MKLLVAVIVVIVVLVLFNLPQLENLIPKASAASTPTPPPPTGTSPQPARTVTGGATPGTLVGP